MSNIKANPPINLAELSPRLAASETFGDEWLADEELQALSIFKDLERPKGSDRAIDFRKFPGATYLWHGTPGRVVTVQGDAGATAFYVVKPREMLALRRQQLSLLTKFKQAPPDDELRKTSYLAGTSAEELAAIEALYVKEMTELESKDLDSEEVARAPVLAVHLLSVEEQKSASKGGWLDWIMGRVKKSAADADAKGQRYIPVDAPVAIDAKQRCGVLHPGDIFGEASCMSRWPRSATVIVEQECYILELARSVFEAVRSDPQQKQKLDAAYRQRMLPSFLERLALFADVDRALIKPLIAVAELETYDAGSMVFEQGDEPDAVYIVRSGLAKIIQNVGGKLQVQDFAPDNWESLQLELGGGPRADDSPVGIVSKSLGAEFHKSLPGVMGSGAPTDAARRRVVEALNALLCQKEVPKQFGKTTLDAVGAVNYPELDQLASSFPGEVKNWSDVERRLFFRSLLEAACPGGIPQRLACYGPMRTLSYRGQGDVIGEMGVVSGNPRNATLAAYDHPDGRMKMGIPDSRGGAVPSQLELVKIKRDDFMRVLNSSPVLKERIDQIVRSRKPSVEIEARPRTEQDWRLRNLPEFEELGLVQGQKLMLIDLDRCTRCGECVKACVSVHTDGQTRLYLDGPRFGDYLVPVSCRKCLDPVCMIGCPVGSIDRGDNGEIRIHNWCIGCAVCERQCPYGSIHMRSVEGKLDLNSEQHDLLREQNVDLKDIKNRAVVCDLCASTSLGREACVYACPHDAAIRVNGMEFSFERG